MIAPAAGAGGHGSTADWLVWSIAALMTLALWPRVWQLWARGQRLRWRRHDYGAAQRADVERAALWSALMLTALLTFAAVYWADAPAPWSSVAAAICGPLAVLGFALMLSLHYLHRPRWAIPPVMRDSDPVVDRFVRHAGRGLHRLTRGLTDAVRKVGTDRRDQLNAGHPHEQVDQRTADGFEEIASGLAQRRRRLAELSAPPTLSDAHARFLREASGYEEFLRTLAADFRSHGSPGDENWQDHLRDDLPRAVRDYRRALLHAEPGTTGQTPASPPPDQPSTRHTV